MNTDQIKSFIYQHSALFWYIPEDKKENISHELLVETIFNYGSLNDALTLTSMLGTENVYRILKNMKGRKKMNMYPEIYNFFMLYFEKNVQRNPQQ
jgi:hypothetical protein